MSRTLSIYKGQVKRAKENKLELNFTREEFRQHVSDSLGLATCPYCQCRLSISNMSVDHVQPISRLGTFNLCNTVICCQSCNYQKGDMNGEEFRNLLHWLNVNLGSIPAANLKRRLTAGGKLLHQGKN